MKQERLKGMVAATFTPMNEDGSIHLEAISRYASWLAKSQMSGVFVCGTTGEFSSLTTQERKEILEEWIRQSAGRFKVIAHVGSNCQQEAVELASHACRAGADAIGAIAPCFFKPESVEDLVDYMAPIAAAGRSLPFYYYHMPSMTKVTLPVADFLTKGKEKMPNLAGVKFTHNNFMEMGECIALNEGAFEVLNGFDEMLLPGLAMGATAGVGSTYNYYPDVYRTIFEAMAIGNLEKARSYQQKSIELVKVIIRYGGGVRGGKAIMNLLGIECGNTRLPIAPFSKEEYLQLGRDLRNIRFFN